MVTSNKTAQESQALQDIDAAVKWASAHLRAITDRPRLEAEVLLAHVLDRPRTFVIAHPEFALTAQQRDAFVTGVQRRATGEPLPYITGYIEFFGLTFAVTPDVLIPRSETELLVETALDWVKRRDLRTVVDLGTGSGCIAVTLAVHAPDLHVAAIDLSAAALGVARTNAERHGVGSRVTFRVGDLLTPLVEPVDLIVSNPPYVKEGEWDALPISVQQEPRLALLAGADGLNIIRRLLQQASQKLRPGGVMLVEIGERQGKAVQELAQTAFPEANVRILRDLAGKDRLLGIVSSS